jgi:GDP-4-dehydro-6-deoxy-D-mannose reductase
MTFVVTGATGFVGGHLCSLLADKGRRVVGVGRDDDHELPPEVEYQVIHPADHRALAELLSALKPAVVVHLAGQSHVGESWKRPEETLDSTVHLIRSVLDAVHSGHPSARVIAVGTSEVYGPPTDLPVTERAQLRPQNPYAVAKATADLLAGFYRDAHGLDVVRTRSFSHAGPRQRPIFALSNFARQIASAQLEGKEHVTVRTGRGDTRRDLSDVRDVVRAYFALAEADLAHDVYNVAAGQSYSTSELVAAVAAHADIEVRHEVDPELVRPNEVPEIVGASGRLFADTGWSPSCPLQSTAADTFDWWLRVLSEDPHLGAGDFG